MPDTPPVCCTALLHQTILQATDDSIAGGLMTTVSELKQLLIGAVLWNPMVFHTVSVHHLASGEPVVADHEHAEATMSGVCLDARQSEVLLIIAGRWHLHLCGINRISERRQIGWWQEAMRLQSRLAGQL